MQTSISIRLFDRAHCDWLKKFKFILDERYIGLNTK